MMLDVKVRTFCEQLDTDTLYWKTSSTVCFFQLFQFSKKKGLANGAIQAYDMSKECIITKLMWALYRSKSLSEVQQILHTNYTGEINVEGKLYGARR